LDPTFLWPEVVFWPQNSRRLSVKLKEFPASFSRKPIDDISFLRPSLKILWIKNMMTYWKSKAVGILSVITIAASFAVPALSADLGGQDEKPLVEPVGAMSPWSFTFTTYGWLSWVSGDLAVKGRPLSVQASPADLINALDWSELPIWMSYAEARNGRLSLFNDIVYSKLAGSADFAASRQGRNVGLALAGNVETDYQQATVELGAGYEVWSGGGSSLDLIAGGRYWHQEANVSANVTATVSVTGPLGIIDLQRSGSRVFARSGSVDWVDPFVGARVRHQLASGHEVTVRGDIGGFGAGSDFSWHVLAAYNFEICSTDRYVLDGYVGYKALSVDYSQGSGNTRYEYDVLQQGPVVGATLRF